MKMSKAIVAAALLQMLVPALAEIPAAVEAPKSAKLGEEVTVNVRTNPKVHCKIEAQDAGLTQAMNLLDKDADTKGKASWTFKIPGGFKADKMPLIITVSKKGQKAEDKVIKEIEIAK